MQVLQALAGWGSVERVRRNAHLSSDNLVEYVDRMSGSLKAVNGTDGVTNQLRATELSALAKAQTAELMTRPKGLESPSPWFEVTPSKSIFQPEQSLAAPAEFADST